MLQELLRDSLANVACSEITTFWTYSIAGGRAGASARPATTSPIASSQKTNSLQVERRHVSTDAPMKKTQAPIVTRWKMPTRSSTVVWSLRSSSCCRGRKACRHDPGREGSAKASHSSHG
jgi:hypothetical protein